MPRCASASRPGWNTGLPCFMLSSMSTVPTRRSSVTPSGIWVSRCLATGRRHPGSSSCSGSSSNSKTQQQQQQQKSSHLATTHLHKWCILDARLDLATQLFGEVALPLSRVVWVGIAEGAFHHLGRGRAQADRRQADWRQLGCTSAHTSTVCLPCPPRLAAAAHATREP